MLSSNRFSGMKKILSFSILITALIITSCVNLNLNPLSEGSSSNWYSSAEEIEMSLSDLYRTDFFPIANNLWGDDFSQRTTLQFTNNGSLTASNGTVSSRWTNYYKGISRCMKLLSMMDNARKMGVPEAKITQYEGEAYFYIGYAYGMLAFYWGDVILYKDVISLEDAYVASRSPKADVLAYSYECLNPIPGSNDSPKEPLTRSKPGWLFGMATTPPRLTPPRSAWISAFTNSMRIMGIFSKLTGRKSGYFSSEAMSL